MQSLQHPSLTTTTIPAVANESPRIVKVNNAENRLTVERFIQTCFFQQHQAKIHSFADKFIALSDRNQCLSAAFGYHSAANRYLFLEQYLDRPIETLLALHGCGVIQRNQILEVGNLASRSSGSTRRIILSLITTFYEQGFRWLVITITPKVLNSFQKLGLDLDMMPLAEAKPERLLNTRDDWGNYYDEKPIVYAGNIEQALLRFQQNPLISKLIASADRPISDHGITLNLGSE